MAILMIKAQDNNVPDSPGKWRRAEVVIVFEDDHELSVNEQLAAGNFYQVHVTDKTKAEADEYMQGWNHDPTVTQLQHDPATDLRRIEVTSTMVSASGKNAFTQSGVEALMADIGGTYVSHTSNSFKFDVTATAEERDFIEQSIDDAVRNMQYARRRWYINAAGMTYLENNGGTVSGTAAQVGGYLRDGLLD